MSAWVFATSNHRQVLENSNSNCGELPPLYFAAEAHSLSSGFFHSNKIQCSHTTPRSPGQHRQHETTLSSFTLCFSISPSRCFRKPCQIPVRMSYWRLSSRSPPSNLTVDSRSQLQLLPPFSLTLGSYSATLQSSKHFLTLSSALLIEPSVPTPSALATAISTNAIAKR